MALQSLTIKNFSGGVGTVGEKLGPENSARFIKHLNPFEDPSYITQSMKTTVGNLITDSLTLWVEDGSPYNTKRYTYTDSGKIYSITSGELFVLERTVSGGTGEGLLVHDNYLYYPQSNEIGRYGPLNGTPAFNDSFSDWWLVTDVQTIIGGTGATVYSTTTSINEGATHRQTITPDHDPVKSITINVTTVGTGDWTVTLHDSNNTEIDSATIVNGSMSTGEVTFSFGSQVRVFPGEQYHIHVTTTVADGEVATETNNSLEGAYANMEFYPLVDADYHMMSALLGGWAIANESYVGFFDNINGEYDPTKIQLETGYVARNIFKHDEYLIIEAYKGSDINNVESARRYYWDGIAPTFNFSEAIPQGAPQASLSYKGSVVGVYGKRGALYAGNDQKLTNTIPKLSRGKTVSLVPSSITVADERILFGINSTTDTGLEIGVYEYGNSVDEIPPALSLPYTPSGTTSGGQTTGDDYQIGVVKAIGTELYIGWQDDTNYGIDLISFGDLAAATFTWESRIFDAGDPEKFKQAVKIEIAFETLTTNQTITPKYKIDRAGSWTSGTAATSGDTKVELFINSLFKEIEFGFDGASSSLTYTKIKSIEFIYEDLADESDDA